MSENTDYLSKIFFTAPEAVDPDDNVLATYYVEGNNITLDEAAGAIAAEESIGSWTEVSTMTDLARSRLPAKVFKLTYEGEFAGQVSIAFPLELFDYKAGGIPNILSIVAGNLFGLSALNNVRLLDVQFPQTLMEVFPGPKLGIQGVRELVGTSDTGRPHVGTIVKPKVGLDPKQTAEVAYEAGYGGCDLIKDDETLTNQRFCPLENRLEKVLESLDRVKEETGRTVLYALNITANFNQMMQFADRAVSMGANMLMVDVITAGFSSLQALARDSSIDVPIHVHRTMHGAFTRNPRHGIDMMVVAKLVRMSGGDQLHTGTAAGKMEKDLARLVAINDFLKGSWFAIKNVFPVASGGIHPGIVPDNVRALGKDLVVQAGAGIHGHPEGTRAGAAAMRQAVEAVMLGKSLEEYGETRGELRAALEKWGRKYG